MYADGTKAHGIDRKKNEINVIIEKDSATAKKPVRAHSKQKMDGDAEQFNGKAETMITDSEIELRNALIDKALNNQLCVRHSVEYVNYQLWKDGLPKEEREDIRVRMKEISPEKTMHTI